MESLSFLRPGFLLGLFGLAIPIAIHLLGRRKVRTVPFTTIRFLRRAQARASARWRLRRILLLVSRLLVVAALSLLFSGPGCMRPSAGGEAPLSWIFILDNSPSMLATDGGPSALERARNQLSQLLMEARDHDRFMVVTTEESASSGWISGFSSDRPSVLAALSNVNIRYGKHDIRTALERALGILAEVQDGRVVLATDLQTHSWSQAGTPPKGHFIHILDTGFPDAVNTWLASVAQEEEEFLLSLGRSPSITEGDEPQVRLEAASGKRLTARARSGKVRFPSPAFHKEELVSATVVPGGYLSVDDTIDFPVARNDYVNVLVVNGDPHGFVLRDETLFLRKALAVESTSLRKVRYQEVRPSEIPLAVTASTEVVILANVGSLSTEAAEVLRSARDKGTGLIFTSGSNWKPLTATGRTPSQEERALESLLPLPLRDQVTVPVGDPLRPPFERIDPASFSGPFTAFANPETGDFGNVQVRSYWVFETAPDAFVEVFLSLQNGAPILLEKRQGLGRSLVLATSMDRDEGDLCLQPAFLPFVHRLVLHAADRLRPDLPSLSPAGQAVSLDFAWPVTVSGPDGVRTFLEAHSAAFVPPEPGAYTLWKNDEKIGVFSAVFPPEESDLTRLSRARLAELLGSDNFVLAGPGEAPLARRYRARDDVTPLVSVVLLGAILAEALLATPWRRKKTETLWERPL